MRLTLKLAILAGGKTQRQIAADARLSENRLSDIVRGWAEPRADEKQALAHVLNQDVGVLFDETRLGTNTEQTGTAEGSK